MQFGMRAKVRTQNDAFSEHVGDTDFSRRTIFGSLGIQIRKSPATLYYSLPNLNCSTPRPTPSTLEPLVPAKSDMPIPATSKRSPRRRLSSPLQLPSLTSQSCNCHNMAPTATHASLRMSPPNSSTWNGQTMVYSVPGHDPAATQLGFTLKLRAHTPTWIIKLMER